MQSSIFYHEDFYRQVELVMQENYFKLFHDFTPDVSAQENIENGFNSIQERSGHRIETVTFKISFNSLKRDLAPFVLKYFDTVLSGYGSTTKRKSNVEALGFERFAIFFELDDEIVKHIWLCQSDTLPKENVPSNLLSALFVLGSVYNQVLVDWNEEIIVRLSSKPAIQKYLSENYAFSFPPQ